MTLTDTELVTLSVASKHEDGLLTKPHCLRGNAAEIFRTKLIASGLAEEVGVAGGMPYWREDGEGARLGPRITPAPGLAAIGVEGAPTNSSRPALSQPRLLSAPRPQLAPAARGSSEVLVLLSRGEGATLAHLIAATGWLPHTGLPPEKWSSLRYGFEPGGGQIDVEEAAQA